MNLALRDVRHDLARYLLTALGLGLLLTVVLAMMGIYNGLILDGTALPDALGADLWIVQRNTRGPFAELSQISHRLEERVRAVAGVRLARSYSAQTIQRERPGGGKLRFAAVGLSWPDDHGERLPIVSGRELRDPHFEAIADRSLALALGERVRLARDVYTIVGLTEGMLASGGDPIVFFTLSDARQIQYDVANEAVRLEREARLARVRASELGLNPENLRRAHGLSSGVPALGPLPVAAIMVDLAPGADVDTVRAAIGAWPDVTVHTTQGERDLLLRGSLDLMLRQNGLFRVLLVVISTILMGLIIYTMTLEKLHSLALLKLLGARTTVILAMILEESLLLGAIAYGIALVAARFAFPYFPRRIILGDADRVALLGIVVLISVVASAVGIRKALAADPNQVLAS
ncbi:MAG: ABC transporter permease [Planctomycetes bacterium]|nr:ABC transporter permease [Planctomycetota bacterium]